MNTTELSAILTAIDALAAAEERLRYIASADKIQSPAARAAVRYAIEKLKGILPDE